VLIRQVTEGRFGSNTVSSTVKASNPPFPNVPIFTNFQGAQNTQTLSNVVRDIARLRSLDHENVVTVHETLVSATRGHIYLVIESFNCDLKDLIQDGGPLGDGSLSSCFFYENALKYSSAVQ